MSIEKGKAKINKAWIPVAVLVILTVVILVFSINSKNFISLPSRSEKELASSPHTSLEFSDSPRIATPSGTYVVDININTDSDKVTLAQLEMSYNPKKLNVIDIIPGSFISNPVVIQKSIDTANGRIKYWLSVPSNQQAISGKGTIAVISFTKPASGSAQIVFLPKTSVSAAEANQSVLKNMIPGLIQILPKNTNSSRSAVPKKSL